MIDLNDYILIYEMLNIDGLNESSKNSVSKIKPTGYKEDDDFKTEEYKEYWLCLIKAIVKNTPLKRNDSSDGVWEELRYDSENCILKAIKKTNVAKNNNQNIKPKKISERVISRSLDETLEIIFGKDVDKELYYTLDNLISFICSTDYKNREDRRINNIYKDFLNLCERNSLTKKLYKIKPLFRGKIDTII